MRDCLSVRSMTEDSCASDQFKCVSSAVCIPGAWLCDRECDCSDCSDECGQCVWFRGVFRGVALAPGHPPPPLKVKKLTSADVMNIIMAVIGLVGLKRAPECIKMHHFEGENAKMGRGHQTPPQLGRGYPFPRPHPSAPPFECLPRAPAFSHI